MRRITIAELTAGVSPWPGPCEIINDEGTMIAYTSGPIPPEISDDVDGAGPLDFSNLGPPPYYDGDWLD